MSISIQDATILLERLKADSDGCALKPTPLEFLCSFYDGLSANAHDVGNFLRQIDIDGMNVSEIFEFVLAQDPEFQDYEFRWYDLNIFLLVPKVFTDPTASCFFRSNAIRIDIARKKYDVRTAELLKIIDTDRSMPSLSNYYGVKNAMQRDVAQTFKKYLEKPSLAGRISLFRTSLKYDGKKHFLRQLLTALTVRRSTLENTINHYYSEVERFREDCLRIKEENRGKAQWRLENRETLIRQIDTTRAMLEEAGFVLERCQYWE